MSKQAKHARTHAREEPLPDLAKLSKSRDHDLVTLKLSPVCPRYVPAREMQ